jgi:hypothetical protein
MMIWALVCANCLLFSGCHRSPPGEVPSVIDQAPVADIPLSQVDLGASVLAAVDNARVAIEMRDRVAAYNDVDEAVAFARQLVNRPSRLLLSEPIAIEPGTSSSPLAAAHVRITGFDVLVKLASARAELESNLQAADADLHDIQRGIPEQLIPTDLQLLKAAASLSLSRSAVTQGRTPELTTQLVTAQLALNAYAGPGHIAEAKALAATIGQTLRRTATLDTTPPNQMSIWLGIVVGWAGSESWEVSRPDGSDPYRPDRP